MDQLDELAAEYKHTLNAAEIKGLTQACQPKKLIQQVAYSVEKADENTKAYVRWVFRLMGFARQQQSDDNLSLIEVLADTELLTAFKDQLTSHNVSSSSLYVLSVALKRGLKHERQKEARRLVSDNQPHAMLGALYRMADDVINDFSSIIRSMKSIEARH